jgi:hypothetical protein
LESDTIDRFSENPQAQRKSTGALKTDRLRKKWARRQSMNSVKTYRLRKSMGSMIIDRLIENL